MMSPPPFTGEFVEWIALNHYRIVVRGDAWVLTDFSDVDFYIRRASDVFVLTKTERGGHERFVMSASNAADVERVLTMSFGFSIRCEMGLPFIFLKGRPGLVSVADAAPGFRLEAESGDRVAVVTETREVRARVYGDLGLNSDEAVKFSWIADARLEDLRRSYLDPGGLPLFPGCSIGPAEPSA